MRLELPLGILLLIPVLLGQDPDDMVTVYREECRLKKYMSIGCQYVHIGHWQELFIQVEFVFDALIVSDVDMSAHQMRCCLNSCIDGAFGDNVCEYLSLFIIFYRHVTSCFGHA